MIRLGSLDYYRAETVAVDIGTLGTRWLVPVTVRGSVGVCVQLGALWVGAHYSRRNRRWCINLLPCLTVWVTLPGGKAP
jgi:hypothetical protein